MEPTPELWEQLTKLTCHEKDPEKRLAIVREIDRLLEERENDAAHTKQQDASFCGDVTAWLGTAAFGATRNWQNE